MGCAFLLQMLIVATRERDAAGAQIESLRRELSLYLSVPAEGKPQALMTMTRVRRMPLINTQNENVNPVAGPTSARSIGKDFERHLPPLAEGASGDMTLDEII